MLLCKQSCVIKLPQVFLKPNKSCIKCIKLVCHHFFLWNHCVNSVSRTSLNSHVQRCCGVFITELIDTTVFPKVSILIKCRQKGLPYFLVSKVTWHSEKMMTKNVKCCFYRKIGFRWKVFTLEQIKTDWVLCCSKVQISNSRQLLVNS